MEVCKSIQVVKIASQKDNCEKKNFIPIDFAVKYKIVL